MKKLFTLVVALAGTTVASFAQISNNSFETWQTKTDVGMMGPYTYEIPQNWELGFLSELTAMFGVSPNVNKGTPAQAGSFALKLSSNADSIGADVTAGFSLGPNARPSGLTGFFRTSGSVTDPNDFGTAMVFLTKWNGTDSDTIGYGFADLDSSPNGFKQFVAPILYSGAANPDSAYVYIMYFPEEANTSILIDNLALLSVLGSKEETAAFPELTFFPNPVSQNQVATLKFNAPKAENATLIIRDVVGREVKTFVLNELQAGANSVPVNTAELKTGLYVATLQSASGSQTFRFVKR